MRSVRKTLCIVLALCASGVAYADAPADAPAGSTGLCKDGTYSTSASKKGACKGHKGVKDWYAAADSKASDKGIDKSAPKTAAKDAAPAAAAAPAPAATSSAAPATAAAKSTSTSAKAAAPGGGPGLVWVNTSSKVYHCQSDKWYGKTKQGEYLSEADAKAKGNRPEGGKACS
jgi:hypothetical protein